jgi:hypothetical protein
MNTDKLNKEIYEEVQKWTVALFAIFKANIKAKKLELTGDLKDSFQHFVSQNAQQLSTRLVIDFANQGRFQDMKVLNFGKMPPLDALEDFVRKKGLGAFEYVPDYHSRFPLRQDVAIRRIAWGIRASFKKRGQVKPNKRWNYAKKFYGEVQDLKDRLQIILLDHTANLTTEQLQNL